MPITCPMPEKVLWKGLTVSRASWEEPEDFKVSWTERSLGGLPGARFEAAPSELVEFDRGPGGRRYARFLDEGRISERELLCIYALEHPFYITSQGVLAPWALDDDGIGLALALSEARVALEAAGWEEDGPGSLSWAFSQALWLPHDSISHTLYQGLTIAAKEAIASVDEGRSVDWRDLSSRLASKAEGIRQQTAALMEANPSLLARGSAAWCDLARLPGHCGTVLEDGTVAIRPAASLNRNDMFCDTADPSAMIIDCGGSGRALLEELRLSAALGDKEISPAFREPLLAALIGEDGCLRAPIENLLWSSMGHDIAVRRTALEEASGAKNRPTTLEQEIEGERGRAVARPRAGESVSRIKAGEAR